MDEGNPEDAEALLRDAAGMLRGRYARSDLRVIEADSQLATCLAALGRYEEAESLVVDSCRALETEYGREDVRTLEARESLVQLATEWGRPIPASFTKAHPRE